jgi:hypothetical protein
MKGLDMALVLEEVREGTHGTYGSTVRGVSVSGEKHQQVSERVSWLIVIVDRGRRLEQARTQTCVCTCV